MLGSHRFLCGVGHKQHVRSLAATKSASPAPHQQQRTPTVSCSSTTPSTTPPAKKPPRRRRKKQPSDKQPVVVPATPPEPIPDGHKCGYVAIIGYPNAGKSTLLNALLGQKLSIVTRKAQTTRHRIVGIMSDDMSQVVWMDTPGVITGITNKLDAKMMEAVRQAVETADGILLVVDSADQPEAALPIVKGAPLTGPPIAVALNKTDLLPREEVEGLKRMFMEASSVVQVVFPCVALEGEGVEEVRGWAAGVVPEGPPLYDKDLVADQPERFFVSEIIREQVFLQYRQEVPYAVSVACTDFKARPHAKDYVEVEVYVERPQQRAILLGKEGSALKKLATASRAELEAFLGRPVYLALSVKIREKWRTDDKVLQQLGY